MRAPRFALSCLLATLIASVPVAAASLDELETRAFALEARGQESDAASAWVELLRAAADATTDTLAPARAELALSRFFTLRASVSARETEASLAELEPVCDPAGPAGARFALVDALRRRYRAHLLANLGQVTAARAEVAKLGYAPVWWVVGPCDNSRGTGWMNDSVAADLDLNAEVEGKERKVKWRRLDDTTYAGYVDLDAIMTPNDEVMAYATTYLYAEQSGIVALRASSDEAIKIWVNGVPVLADDVRRPARFDQDHVTAALEKGWNTVVVKICEGEGEWRMALRVTALDGTSASGVRFLEVGEAAPESPVTYSFVEGEPPEPAEGLAAGGASLLAAAGEDAPAWVHRDLGILLAMRHVHDRATFPHKEALQRAIDLDPEDPASRYHFALASQVFAERTADREENAYRNALLETLEVDPDNVQALESLGRYYRESLDIRRAARGYFERALAVCPDHVESRLGLAGVLGARGWTVEERLMIEKLVDERAGDLRVLRRVGGLRASIGDRARAAAIWEQLFEVSRQDEWLTRTLVDHYRRTGRDDDALAVLAGAREIDPFDAEIALATASIANVRDDIDGALATLDAYLLLAPENVMALFARARMLRRAGREDEAVAALNALMAITPGDVAAKDYVDFLEPEEPEFEERFLTDTAEVIESGRVAEHSTDEGAVTLLRREVERVHKDGTSATHVQIVRKITGVQGVRETSRGIWLRGSADLDIKEARLISADGSVRQCKRRGRRVVPPPPVEVGDIFDIRYRTQDTEPSSIFDKYYGNTLYFGDFERVENLEYVIVAPTEMPLYFAGEEGTPEPISEEDEEHGVVITRFIALDVPRTEQEPLMPPADEIFPDVQVSSYASWGDFAQWWWGMIKKQYVMTDEMREKLAELVEGLETPEDKVAAIYHFVTKNIRYVAWEFGVHGYKPYEASTIFGRRFGDCKDKAILMNTMFEEIGLQSHPVLIRLVQNFESRGREDLRLPTLTHFNHCISKVVLPSGDEVYLDGTAKNYGFSMAPPRYDRGATVLVVDPEGGEIQQIPYFDAEYARTRERLDVKLDTGGGGSFLHRIEVPSTGQEEWRSTLELADVRVAKMNRYYAGRLAGTSVDEVRTSDLDDLGADVWVEAEARAPGIAESRDGRLQVPTGVFRTTVRGRNIEDIASLDRRSYDLVLGPPEASELDIVYELPPGWRLLEEKAPIELECEFARYSLTVTEADGKVTVRRSFETLAPRVPVARYEEFRELCVAAGNAEKQKLVIVKEGR